MKRAYPSSFGEDLMNDFSDALKQFVAFFTIKNLVVCAIVAFALVCICSPRQVDEQVECNGDSCPMRHP